MAEAFQPRFVDLVRNTTKTQGTGNFELGAALSGHRSFAGALAAGESFYYSVIGVDKPDEREIGRGTMEADGTISRVPVSGEPTNFTAGTKTIALVAAAEWFDTIQAAIGSAGGSAQAAPTRAALGELTRSGVPAILCESGREGICVFDGSDLSALVAADTAQGVFIAPASDTSGASGAWVRRFDGPVNPEWFGIVSGDDSANGAANTAAFQTMQAVLALTGSYHVQFPHGTYWFADSGAGAGIEFANGNFIVEGSSSNGVGATTAWLKFPAGVTGIRVHNALSSGANSKDAVAHSHAIGITIRNLGLKGSFSGTEAEAHGIQLRAKAALQHLNIKGFEGDGIRAAASATAPDGNEPPYGNINLTSIERVSISECRNGFYVNGLDANMLAISELNVVNNRQWGIWDSSFLGNSYTACHTATNGETVYNDGVTTGASVVSDGTYQYFAIAGQEAGASTNPPSGAKTDTAFWAYLQPGGAATGRPLWFNGILVRAGGAVYDDDVNSRCTYTSCYAEQDQAMAQIAQRSLVTGGMLSLWCHQNPTAGCGTAIIKSGNNGNLETEPALQVTGGSVTTILGGTQGNSNNRIIYGSHSTVSPSGHSLLFSTGLNALLLTRGNSASLSQLQILVTGETTGERFGTGVDQPDTVLIPRLALNNHGNNRANSRRLWIDVSAPSSGAHGQGEWTLHRGTGYQVGWKCTGFGTPGTHLDIHGVQASLAGAAQAANVAGPSAGTTVDSEARAAIGALFDSLRTAGLMAST